MVQERRWTVFKSGILQDGKLQKMAKQNAQANDLVKPPKARFLTTIGGWREKKASQMGSIWGSKNSSSWGKGKG